MRRAVVFAVLVIAFSQVLHSQSARERSGTGKESSTETDAMKLREGFGMWTPSELKEHEKVLDSKIGPDHSARETLGNYGNHKIRFIHRVGTGAPEFHTYFVDLWIVESGHGTLVVGGTLNDPKPLTGNEAVARGDMTGSSIQGGERHDVSAGDVIHIPPKTPHQILVSKGDEITYLRIAIPSE
jgi:mannose-6-phosphate isomerase-like protein (cupin superfamily)